MMLSKGFKVGLLITAVGGLAVASAFIGRSHNSQAQDTAAAVSQQQTPALAAVASGKLVIANHANASDVTIYGRQFAHIQETREVTLPAGHVRLQLNGISTKYREDSLRLISVKGTGKFTYRWATYQQPNLTNDRVLAESIGKQVTAWRNTKKGLEPITGTLESASGSALVISVGTRTELVNTADVSVLHTPQGLTNTAALVIEADVETAGVYSIEFQYATDGLSWSAKHSVIYDEDAGKVESWATHVSVVNDTGVVYRNATVNLLSGKVAVGVDDAPGGGRMYSARSEAAMAPSANSSVESVGDQNVFTLPGTVDLTSGPSRQIPLFDQSTYGRDVPVKKTYVVGNNQYGYTGTKQQATIRLTVENCEKHHLGKPLPGGVVEVQQRKSGRTLQLTGRAVITEKAQDEVFDMNIATSSDVKWELKLVARKEVKGENADEAGNEEAAAATPRRISTGSTAPVAPVATSVFEEREYELVVYNFKRDKAVEVKVEIAATLKELPKGWKQSAVGQAETSLTVPKSDKVSAKFTTRTRVR